MAKQSAPYWLVEGSETCHVCTHRYTYEVGMRCVACDRGVCCHCVIVLHDTGEAWCPGCRASGEEE